MDPMISTAQKRADIGLVSEIVREITFQMDRFATKEPVPNKLPHLQHLGRELKIMSRCYLQPAVCRQPDQLGGFMGIDGKWFLQVNMTPRFEALLANRVMALRRRSNVDNIRLDQTKHFLHGRKAFRNTEPLAQLFGHQQLP